MLLPLGGAPLASSGGAPFFKSGRRKGKTPQPPQMEGEEGGHHPEEKGEGGNNPWANEATQGTVQSVEKASPPRMRREEDSQQRGRIQEGITTQKVEDRDTSPPEGEGESKQRHPQVQNFLDN